jgi:hypothetical protein
LSDSARKPATRFGKPGRIAPPRSKLKSLGGRGHFPGPNAARRACKGLGEELLHGRQQHASLTIE